MPQNDRQARHTARRGRVPQMLAVIVVAAVLVVAGSLMAHWMADDAEDGGADGIRVLPGADTKAGPDLDPSGDSGDQDAPISPAVMPAAERIAPDSADWQELLPRLQQAARADPTDRNAQRKLALAYYNLGRLTEALGIYEALLKAEEDPVLRNRLGNTLRDMGDTGGAEDAYRQAIAEDPALAPPYLNLAELLWRQGRTDEALAIIDRGIAAVPEEQRAALQAARALLSDSR